MSNHKKKTWREIDSGRGRSGQRRSESPGSSPYERRSTKSYKAELDRFFDHGVASERIKSVVSQGGPTPTTPEEPENPERTKLIRTLRAAETFDDFVNSVVALRSDHGGLPNDVEILTRTLEHPDVEAVHEAIERLTGQVKRLTLIETKALKARLQSLETAYEDDDDTLARVAALRELL